MSACFCTGECHKTGRCPNAPWSMDDLTKQSIEKNRGTNLPCANDAMDEWERKNLRPEDRGKPRMLYWPVS